MPPSGIPSSKYTSTYLSQLNIYIYCLLPYIGPGRTILMMSNLSCLRDGCSEKMDLGPLIMKFPAVPELMMAISQL